MPTFEPFETGASVRQKINSVITAVEQFTGEGGTHTRTITEKLRDVVSVKDWGARGNGIDNDQPAIQALIDRFKGTNYYGPGGVEIVFPSGDYRLNASIDMTDAHGVVLRGCGMHTWLSATGNFPVIDVNNTTAAPLHAAGATDMTLFGGGNALANAHGLDLGATNNCFFDRVRIWRANVGVRAANAWMTRLQELRIDGAGTNRCNDALWQVDGNLAVIENALVIIGGQYKALRWGWRVESGNGTRAIGMEILDCGAIGAFWGNSPGGKPLQWLHAFNCLVDTCQDLVVIQRGTSSISQDWQWDNTWLGYAYEDPPGVGCAVSITGATDASFHASKIVNVGQGLVMTSCDRVAFRAGSISDYDRLGQGWMPILVQSSNRCRIDVGTTKKAAAATATNAITENGSSNRNLFTGVYDGTISTVGAQTVTSQCIT